MLQQFNPASVLPIAESETDVTDVSLVEIAPNDAPTTMQWAASLSL
jgi:hypothetical protein